MTPQQLFERHHARVKQLAKKLLFPRYVAERDDVVSAALMGLWQACVKLAPLQLPDHEFLRASYPWIRGSVRDMLRQTNWVSRRQFKNGVRFNWDQEFEIERIVQPENDTELSCEQAERMNDITVILETIPFLERQVVVECALGGRLQIELAREHGVSHARISQRLTRAIKMIRARLLTTA